MKKLTFLLLGLCLLTPSAKGQFGLPEVVIDPKSIAVEIKQVAQEIANGTISRATLVQALIIAQQLATTYQLATRMATPLGGMSRRYLVNWSPWLYAASRDVYGNATPWVRGANTGLGVPPAYNQATVPLQVYNPAVLAAMPPPIQQNLQSGYATLELRDGAAQTALQTIGDIRANSAAASMAVANVQADSFSGEGFMNNQVTVLNKVNATGVLGLETQQDTNKLLVSILEQQTIAAKHIRDAQAESINAEVYRQTNGQALNQQLTGGIQSAIANFTIP